jgi:CubicO group peptidase (beta-lactamase class C family)
MRQSGRCWRSSWRAGRSGGLQVAAYHKGRLVIDSWAGLADASTGRAVDGDTLFPVFSTTKGITCAAIHLLSERGILERVV